MKRFHQIACEGQVGREQGAALLSVLLIVAAMSVAAVSTMDSLVKSVSVSRINQDRTEAIWAVRSAEAFGISNLQEAYGATSGSFTADTPLFGQTQNFQMPRFKVSAVMRLSGNCFNLNALANSSQDDASAGNDNTRQQYIELLKSVGLFENEAQKLADTLTDWLDADDIPRVRGAESRYYEGLDVPYRPSGTLLSNLTELNAIAGYTEDVQAAFSHLVCAYPTRQQNTLNINALSPAQSPLLTALFSAELSPDAARNLIESRPINGWLEVAEFLQLEEINKIAETARLDQNLVTTTRYFEMSVDLVSTDQSAYGDYLFQVTDDGIVETVWRREGGQR